jgi:hypothetical protein
MKVILGLRGIDLAFLERAVTELLKKYDPEGLSD